MAGFFDKMFDFTHDGKLNGFEKQQSGERLLILWMSVLSRRKEKKTYGRRKGK